VIIGALKKRQNDDTHHLSHNILLEIHEKACYK